MNIFNPEDRRLLTGRVEALGPNAPRLWGSMTLPQALAHLALQLELALGEIAAVQPIRTPARWPVVRHWVIHFLPWPRGLPTAPALLESSAAELDLERERLLTRIDSVVKRGPEVSWAEHPAFGRISGRDWGVLMARHMDHHLRQFSA
ncbi:MAG: DUF1569 domain-containing protein [Acidobacteriota bacterium]